MMVCSNVGRSNSKPAIGDGMITQPSLVSHFSCFMVLDIPQYGCKSEASLLNFVDF